MTIRLVLTALVISAATLPAQLPFIPGTVTRPDSGEAFGTFTPDERQFIYTIHPGNFSKHRIVSTRLENGRWTSPVTLPFSGTFNDREPKLSPDGRRLYFSSNRPHSRGDSARGRDLDLWYADRQGDTSWSAPRRVEGVNSTDPDFSPVVTANGTLYFISRRNNAHGVWRARPVDLAAGRWATAERLGPEINEGFETNVYVTPDESLMLVSRDGAPDSFGGDDLYMSRRVGDTWQRLRHLDAPINSKEYEYGPLVTPKGRRLVFTSHRTGNGDIYTISLGELEREDVRRTALDYIEGFYEGDTAKLMRALVPDLFKFGFSRDTSGTYRRIPMTFPGAMDFAKRVKASNRPPNPQWPRQVDIFEVQDQTASVKVTAWWGTDYMLLAKVDGRWMITHVIWQGPLERY